MEVIPVKRSRAYQRTDVKDLNLNSLRDRAVEFGDAGTAVGLDVGKDEMVGCLRWPHEEFERPWSIGNPTQIKEFMDVLKMLKSSCDSLTIGMESTGTYGEAVRRALTEGGFEVHRVSSKATSDYKEIFDGVPSQHDGKDAAIIAELTAFGKGKPWPYQADSEKLSQVKYQISRLEAYRNQQGEWLGRLEGCLARHWPELTSLLELGSPTLLQMIVHYQSPARLAADAEASTRLSRWGGVKLKPSKISLVIESARTTHGIPVDEAQAEWLGEIANNALMLLRRTQDAERQISQLMRSEPLWSRYTEIGAATLAAIWVYIGDPRDYSSGGALLKAMGLNLKERSSGKRKGELAITKRGPSEVRRWLYFWALRAIQREELKSWYEEFIRVGRKLPAKASRDGKQEHRKMKGVVSVMRKLARGLRHAMIHDEAFDYAKLIEAPRRRRRKRNRRRSVVSAS
jgi:transposase